MNNVIFTNGLDLESLGRERKIINFLNNHDLYWASKSPIFRESISGSMNTNLIDGFLVSLFLSISNLKSVRRLRGPVFSRKFLENKKITTNKKILFIGLEKDDLLILTNVYPHLKSRNLFSYNPPYIKNIEFTESEIVKISKIINSKKIDYVFVGIGCPKQNILSFSLFKKTKADLFLNVGAALDFILGKKKESGGLFQKIGLEWLYRLLTDFKHSKTKVLRSFIATKSLFSAKLK